MATTLTMPKLGLTMTEGKVVKWFNQDGEQVVKGQPLVVVMSRKITYEVEAPASGILHIVAQPKETRKVTEVIGFVLEPGEPIPEAGAAPEGQTPAPAPGGDEPREVRSSPAARRLARELGVDLTQVQGTGRGGRISERDVQCFYDESLALTAGGTAPEVEAPREVRSSPAARRLARELGVDLGQVQGTGREGRISEQDVQRFYDELPRIEATPLARRMAEEEGLDLAQMEGTGPGGRITEEDVLRALEGLEAPAAALPRVIAYAGMRQAIGETMVESLHSMAQLTLTSQADVTSLVDLRSVLRQRWGAPISYTDLIVKAAATALHEHPLLNSTLVGNEILLREEINIGVAVALDQGLIVPVVRDADRRSLPEIHQALQDLALRAHAGTLLVDEVTGGTFTVTNLGMHGVDSFTPIINPPEVAILGVGRITEHLVLANGQVAARSKMALSLTIDHRIVDGAPGAAFLRTVVQFLEHPALIFAQGPATSGPSQVVEEGGP
jgi:pyruvate dehydrogenase E2 component (dihydrolipoamide acetyltransferase)